MTAVDYNSMYNLGLSDGTRDNGTSSDAWVTLDFGQVSYQSGVYGTQDFASGYPFISDSQVRDAVKAYADGWYANTGPCPRLHVVMGTNNYVECPFQGSCSISSAGDQWATYVGGVKSYFDAKNYSWQITPWGGDDMETGWDCASPTRHFIDGYGTHMSNTSGSLQERLLDYGDAWANAPCWYNSDIYYKAYGAPWDWPYPEIYSQSAADRWTYIRTSQGTMNFLGVLTECNVQSDPLPGGDCQVRDQNGNIHYEFSPTEAYNALYADLNNNGVGQSLEFESNIKRQ